MQKRKQSTKTDKKRKLCKSILILLFSSESSSDLGPQIKLSFWSRDLKYWESFEGDKEGWILKIEKPLF